MPGKDMHQGRTVEQIPLLTTVIGSYPTDGLPPRRALQHAVEQQLAAGIELISDGQVRDDMISLFARNIPGMRQASDGVWEIEAALDVPATPTALADYLAARTQAGNRAEVKGVVTGPITLALACRVARSSPYTGPTDPSLLIRLAEIQGHEAAALAASGARVVQIDEPALSSTLGTRIPVEVAHDLLRDLAAIVPQPVLHICGDIRAIALDVLLLPFAALAIENTRIPNVAALDHEAAAEVGLRLCCGVIDTQTTEIETVATLRERITAAVEANVVPPDRLWIAPDCGLRMLPVEVAQAKLQRMAQAVQDVRATL